MYGGMCTAYYALSMIRLAEVLTQKEISFECGAIQNDALITRARNTLADYFLKSDATHLVFIDGDIGFNPSDLLEMLDADKPVVCGLYPKKEINWPRITVAVQQGVPPAELMYHTGSFVVNFANDTNTAPHIDGSIFEIHRGGTGFMLVKREVFLALQDKVPTYINDMVPAAAPETDGSRIREFFAVGVDPATDRLLSEDYHFCNIVRDAGFSIWAAPWVNLTHTGTHVFHGMSIRKS